jgi:hypothetical protein
MTKKSYSKLAMNAMSRASMGTWKSCKYGLENTRVERWENYICRSQGKIKKNGL